MKRAVLVGVLVAVGALRAEARRVVQMPSIQRMCARAQSWDRVKACVGKFGKVRVERELGTAKLVSVGGDLSEARGLYLYVQRGNGWRIAGMFETPETVDIEKFQLITLAKHTGFRIDLGFAETATRGAGDAVLVQQKVSIFCAGTSARCSDIRTSCDLFINGTSRESFRGSLTFRQDTVVVEGDRSRLGAFGDCSIPEELDLEFANSRDEDLLAHPRPPMPEIEF